MLRGLQGLVRLYGVGGLARAVNPANLTGIFLMTLTLYLSNNFINSSTIVMDKVKGAHQAIRYQKEATKPYLISHSNSSAAKVCYPHHHHQPSMS